MKINELFKPYREALTKYCNSLDEAGVASDLGNGISIVKKILCNTMRTPNMADLDVSNYFNDAAVDVTIPKTELMIVYSLLIGLKTGKLSLITYDNMNSFKFENNLNKIVLVDSYSYEEFAAKVNEVLEADKNNTELADTEKYHLINRFKADINLPALISQYGDKLFVRLSAKFFYDNGHKSLYIMEHDLNDNSRLLTPNGRAYFLANYKEIYNGILEEADITELENLIVGNGTFEFGDFESVIAKDIKMTGVKEVEKYFTEAKNAPMLYEAQLNKTINTLSSSILSCEKEISNNNAEIAALKAVDANTTTADNIIKFLSRQVERGVIHDFEIISNQELNNCNEKVSLSDRRNMTEVFKERINGRDTDSLCAIRLHINWAGTFFIDKQQLKARIGNSCCDCYDAIRNYIIPRNDGKPSEIGLNYLCPITLMFFISKTGTISFQFLGEGIDNGLYYDNFNNSDLYCRLTNAHARYHCLGSFRERLSELSSKNDYVRYISNILQYYQTLTPGDSAGDNSITCAPIVEISTGKVLFIANDTLRLLEYSLSDARDAYSKGNLYINKNYWGDMKATGKEELFVIRKEEKPKESNETNSTATVATETAATAE